MENEHGIPATLAIQNISAKAGENSILWNWFYDFGQKILDMCLHLFQSEHLLGGTLYTF